MEPGTWRLGLEGGGECGTGMWVGKRITFRDLVGSPRKVGRRFPVTQCDNLDTMQDLIWTCKDALNELFLAGRNKGFLNEESARQQSFLWPFPLKWFAFLTTVHGGEQMSFERGMLIHARVGRRGRLLSVGNKAVPRGSSILFHVFVMCLSLSFPLFVFIYFNQSSLSMYLSCDCWCISLFICDLAICLLFDLFSVLFLHFDFFELSKKLIFLLFFSDYPRDSRVHPWLSTA